MADGLSTLSNNGSPTHTQRPSFHQVLTRLDAAMLRRLPIVLGWRDADSGEYLQSECRLLYFLDAGPIFSVFARDVNGRSMRIAVDAICAFPSVAPRDLGKVLRYPTSKSGSAEA